MATQTNKARRELERDLIKRGNSPAVGRFLGGYSNLRTKQAYASNLAHYFDWLKETKGIIMTLDEMVKDNLAAVYSSDSMDIARTKKQLPRLTIW
jgi:hypothetical protein